MAMSEQRLMNSQSVNQPRERICLLAEHQPDVLTALAHRFGLYHDANHPLVLVQTGQRLELRRQGQCGGAVFVDFVSGALAWRRQYGGGRQEALVKAVGVKGDYLPCVLDATAGLGRDAFILAAAGCRVHMLERHPVVAALLEDGLRRGYQDSHIGGWLRQRLTLQYGDLQVNRLQNHLLQTHYIRLNSLYHDSLQSSFLQHSGEVVMPPQCDPAIEVVYLDPMFPKRSKSALVRQPMQLLQTLVGSDNDADSLLQPARLLASKRVVVKRPAKAPLLNNIAAQGSIQTKNHRFDIYAPLVRDNK